MNNATAILTDHTKKYNIPLSHLEHRYIQDCTDECELEQIYKELISGDLGSFPVLEELTLDRIRNVQPQSQILRQDKLPLSDSQSTNSGNQPTAPKSDVEWQKHTQKVSREFESDGENVGSDDDDEQPNTRSYEENKRLHLSKQHRLNGDTAFKSTNYQQSIDLYTKSLALNENVLTYLNRTIAYFKLDNFDASIQDCMKILLIDAKHVPAWYYRASCYGAKRQYEEAKRDLNYLLTIDPGNTDAQDLLNEISTLQKTIGDHQGFASQPSSATLSNSNNVSQSHSPSTFDPFQLSSSHDDGEDMTLGDDTGGNLLGNLSDDEGHLARSINVSPTMDDDSDAPELINNKPLQTPPITPISNRNSLSTTYYTHTNNKELKDLYHKYNSPTISNNYSTNKHHTISSNNNDTYIQTTAIDDAISNSNFCSMIQSWLRDSVAAQSTYRSSSYYERPWSKSARPWSLDKIQRDIERFNRFQEYDNAIEVSKKMLQNGILDYHHHAEYIISALTNCAECYLELKKNSLAILYATEALQYNKLDIDALICRAKAFENENFYLFSCADYERVPENSFKYYIAQCACDGLLQELISIEGESWREKLPNDQNDDERYFAYLKLSKTDSYEWYRRHGDQCYLNACFILAIRCYTHCIQLQVNTPDAYVQRAACYLKVFETQKAIADCDVVLKEDQHHFLALYYKASAYKIARDEYQYEEILKECLKIQPNNQIALAEYYASRRESIPRKKRRIRTLSTSSKVDISLSYEELEQLRLNVSLSTVHTSDDIKDHCSFLLHSFQSIDLVTKTLLELIITTTRRMIEIEVLYQQEHPTMILPFSYTQFCFDLLVRLTTLPQLDTALFMLDEHSRRELDDLLKYYSSISSLFNDVDKLNRLKTL